MKTNVDVLEFGAVPDGATGVNASNTITANRIEWNRLGGMRITGPDAMATTARVGRFSSTA